MLGMPGVSITLNPVLSDSTVIISCVVPGKADSVSTTGSCFFLRSAYLVGVPLSFFLSLVLIIELMRVDFPELVVPMT